MLDLHLISSFSLSTIFLSEKLPANLENLDDVLGAEPSLIVERVVVSNVL